MRTPRVYIVNASGHNHHLAARYGDLVPITSGYVSQGSLDRVFHDVITVLHDSEPGDWLLISGLMFLNAIASAIWLQKHKSLNLLVWDKKHNRYRQFETDVDHINSVWAQSNGRTGSETGPS